jgi:YVTN family beta-propeller protein
VFRTDDFSQVATIPVGALPHGLWPSGDGTRIYVGLENGDGVTAIDTLTNKVIATTAIGQAPQALTALSRQRDVDAEWECSGRPHAASVADCHCAFASALKIRSVDRQMRWR